MINELLNDTTKLIKNCEKLPEEEKDNTEQKESAKKNFINDFKNPYNTLKKKIKESIQNIRNTTFEDQKETQIQELSTYLNEYLIWLEGCQKIYEQIEKTNCSKAKECFQLVQFLTIFNERKNHINYTNNLEGQIATLKRILHEMNRFYQALFNTSDELIFENILPREKDVFETVEDYKKEVQNHMEKLNNINKEKINKLIYETRIEEQTQKIDMNRETAKQNVQNEEQNLEKNTEKKENQAIGSIGNLSGLKPVAPAIEENDIKEDMIFDNTSENIEENQTVAEERNPSNQQKEQEVNNIVPDFLKPYVEEAKVKNDKQLIEKRNQAIKIYKEKLYKQMEFYNSQKAVESLSPDIYQKTLPYQEICVKEINRLQNLSPNEIDNPNIDLNIPDENMSINEILSYLLQNQNFSHSSKESLKSYPTLEKPLEYLPVISKKKYTSKGMTSKKTSQWIKRNAKKIAIAALFFLGVGKGEFLSNAQIIETPIVDEKEIDFESLLNIGDLVELKSYDIKAFETPDVKESSQKIPLYAPDYPRTVRTIFMKSPKNEMIEIHEDRERNFYLEQGYEMLSVGLIDGYYKINDVVSLEKELGIK